MKYVVWEEYNAVTSGLKALVGITDIRHCAFGSC
ncbi:Uncharacterised protein [Salmonella enterica subsp. houtenae serovar Houten]|nr:Uncharacterised protein [Salmonella enterica subsp. houtenae serovar Houten]SUF53188.1 Uncharacterised protein [Salmonella enterica]VEA95138.1 Uncharacterised protein [Salmonella enterica subsp. houtenae]VFS10097.1 Uncharacterised protein [Salmonella enterica subsp. houtenae]VUD26282.1 Uncharacterised protein [Salmonella sp. NCTC 7297]